MGERAVSPRVRAVAAGAAASMLLSLPARAQPGAPTVSQDAGAASAEAAASAGVLRVIAEVATVRTGPGFTYRAIYSAGRGETLRAFARAPSAHWFAVELPDGTAGWVLGDEVLPLMVDPTAPAPPGFWGRLADAVFSPAPLAEGSVGLSFSAGVLGGEGLVLFRPAVLLAPHLAIEGYVGETVGRQITTLFYGAAANLYLWPRAPVTPFFCLGGGGTYGRRKVDQLVMRPDREGGFTSALAGGGLLIAFKKRITLRFDFRNFVVFSPNRSHELQEYSAGLAVVF